MVHFPCHLCYYWEWFDIDVTCNVSAVLSIILQARAPYSEVSVWDATPKHGKSLCLKHWLGWKPRGPRRSQRQVCYKETGGQTGCCFQHLSSLVTAWDADIYQDYSLESRFVITLSVWLIPSHPQLPGKEMSYSKDQQANKHPTPVRLLIHLYIPPFQKFNFILVSSMMCSAQIIKYGTAFNDESWSPSEHDILPTLFLHVISGTKVSLPV